MSEHTAQRKIGWYPVPERPDLLAYWDGSTWAGYRDAAPTDAATELAALKANLARQAAAQRAKYTGWKPLTIWYTFWGLMFAIGSVAALFSGSVGTFAVGAVLTALIGLYVKYLYGGGTRRVWFMIF